MTENAPTATVHEVAHAAGVSPATVSRILNGSARVSDAKRRAVEQAIAQLNYRPNLLAQSLKSGRAMTIGILTPDVVSPFFTESLRGIEAALVGTGYAPLIVSGHWRPDEESNRVELLIARRVDGIVILSGGLTESQIASYAQRIPIVATGHQLRANRALGITFDQYQGARMAMQHLIEMGHQRIAFIAGLVGHGDAKARLQGYEDALAAAGIAFDPQLVVQGNFLENGGILAVNLLLEAHQQFSAIFAANDHTAYGARLALYRRGIRVPEDVSVIGFDDLPASSYVTPPLTTIRQPVFEAGRVAAQSLLHLIRGESVAVPSLALELIVRESVKCLR
ncbi:LacI family transcriptional regulator [Chitinivorax tropicus]|uniref:LacI family transcriptional regulator n=1 Tax=Chitinivorax tropicus TaxID=714531 RepID=A0A840MFM2_9PROT|nr:LacI family DNA-binding transcriptional regulator [Chitinivorax tropicus]MBB5018054.1 LacI family transcriptional regulator [Chitinivorax tropicus]